MKYTITNLKEIRTELRLTQTEFYEAVFKKFTVGCKNTISQWEKGENIKMTYFRQIEEFVKNKGLFIKYKLK